MLNPCVFEVFRLGRRGLGTNLATFWHLFRGPPNSRFQDLSAGAPRVAPGEPLGPPWHPLGRSWDALGTSLGAPRRPWGATWSTLGSPWGAFGWLEGAFGSFQGAPGSFLGAPGSFGTALCKLCCVLFSFLYFCGVFIDLA